MGYLSMQYKYTKRMHRMTELKKTIQKRIKTKETDWGQKIIYKTHKANR